MYDREEMRRQLLDRANDAYDGWKGGSSYRYFKEDSDIPLFNPKPTKDDAYIIDIIAYIVGPNYPLFNGNKVIKEGMWQYKLDIQIHQRIGPTQAWVVCLLRNFNLPCPICEDVLARTNAGEEWDSLKGIAAKRRCAFNVIVYDGKNNDRIQVWEASHKYSDGPIRLQAKSPRTGGVEPFYDPDIGKSISFTVANDTYRTIQGHKLVDRDYNIPDSIMKQAYILDEEIVVLKYNEIKEIYYATKSVQEETHTRRPRVAIDTKGESDVPDFNPVEETKPKETNVASQRSLRQPQEAVVESKAGCKFGYVFGEDIDRKPECGACRVYDDCSDEAEKIRMKRKSERIQQQAGTGGESVASQRRLRRPQTDTETEDVPF